MKKSFLGIILACVFVTIIVILYFFFNAIEASDGGMQANELLILFVGFPWWLMLISIDLPESIYWVFTIIGIGINTIIIYLLGSIVESIYRRIRNRYKKDGVF